MEFEQGFTEGLLTVGDPFSLGESTVKEVKLPKNSSTIILGMRTTRECFQSKTIRSVQFILGSQYEDGSICDYIEPINFAEARDQESAYRSTFCSDLQLDLLEMEPDVVV